MPKYSHNRLRIIVYCTPDQHQRFYAYKKIYNRRRKGSLSSYEYLDIILELIERDLGVVERIKSY